VHRRQLTFDYLDTATGEVRRGRIMPADRAHLRAWLTRFAGQDDVRFALEGCTGWRYVVLRREALFVRVEVRDLRRRPVAAGR
jgi:transposase